MLEFIASTAEAVLTLCPNGKHVNWNNRTVFVGAFTPAINSVSDTICRFQFWYVIVINKFTLFYEYFNVRFLTINWRLNSFTINFWFTISMNFISNKWCFLLRTRIEESDFGGVFVICWHLNKSDRSITMVNVRYGVSISKMCRCSCYVESIQSNQIHLILFCI